MANISEILASYSPEDMTIVIANDKFSHVINGYADGTFVSIAREVPASTLYVGSDLSNARVVRANKASTITLSLHQSSESTDVLSQLLANDEETRDDTWTFSVTVKDNIGRSLFFSPQAFIGNSPDATYSTSIENRDWMIQCVSLSNTQGGNGKLSSDTAATLTGLGATVADKWL